MREEVACRRISAWKLLLAVVAAVAAAFLAMSLAAMPAHAKIIDDGWHGFGTLKSGGVYRVVLDSETFGGERSFCFYDDTENGNFASPKSSNKKVAKVALRDQGNTIDVMFKKAGKVTITFKYKGKAKKVTLIAANYRNPLKSFKVGKTQYVKKYDKKPSYNDTYTDDSKESFKGKLVVTPAKGWKVVSIEGQMPKASKALKSGMKIKNTVGIVIVLKHAKTKTVEKIHLYSNYDEGGLSQYE
jgi:hypothetical protein